MSLEDLFRRLSENRSPDLIGAGQIQLFRSRLSILGQPLRNEQEITSATDLSCYPS